MQYKKLFYAVDAHHENYSLHWVAQQKHGEQLD